MLGRDLLIRILGAVLAAAAMLGCQPARADEPLGQAYRGIIIRSAYRIHGPGAPIAALAAQVRQESGFKPDATSWVGAQGLTQFMPGTATDIARQYPADCAPANPLSPQWAVTCRDRLMHQLVLGSSVALAGKGVDECSVWAFAFRGYNGGPGWMRRDRQLAAARGLNPNDWHAVRNLNAGRRESAHRENREYPERIFRYEPLYSSWGRTLGCGSPSKPAKA